MNNHAQLRCDDSYVQSQVVFNGKDKLIIVKTIPPREALVKTPYKIQLAFVQTAAKVVRSISSWSGGVVVPVQSIEVEVPLEKLGIGRQPVRIPAVQHLSGDVLTVCREATVAEVVLLTQVLKGVSQYIAYVIAFRVLNHNDLSSCRRKSLVVRGARIYPIPFLLGGNHDQIDRERELFDGLF